LHDTLGFFFHSPYIHLSTEYKVSMIPIFNRCATSIHLSRYL